MSKLKEQFINSFASEISILNGTDFEYLCKPIFALITNQEVLHKGHNLNTKPVGYTADFISSDLKTFGQCGTEADYFTNLEKPIHDINRSLENHKKCDKIFLFSNRRASGRQLSKLQIEINAKWQNLIIDSYDSERIASVVLKNIHNTRRVEEILKYLPKTFEYYRILPQTNKLPSFKTKYFERNEEMEVKEKLNNQNFLQIFGISGIGKTEFSISVANSIQNEFESIIWLDGDSIENKTLDLSSVHISKFNNSLNLEYFLQEFKILLIVDNLNSNVNELMTLFNASNKHTSKCIITSLQRNVSLNDSYNLSFLDTELAEKILYNSTKEPTKEQVDLIVSEVLGYPLLLNLIVSAVEVDDFSWDEIINEIKNLKDFSDSKNIKLSQRIIGKFNSILNTEFQWINRIGIKKISRHFLTEILGKRSIVELEKRSLIRIQDSFFFDTHQLILDSIKSETTNLENLTFMEGLEKYFYRNNEIKSIDYYRFLFNHNVLINELYENLTFENELKKYILYALIQTNDSFNSPEWFLKELAYINFDNSKYYDLLLFIEKSEIELFQIEKKSEVYEEKSKKIIEELDDVLENTEKPFIKVLLYHHIGKFYLKIKDDENAISYFNKVISIDINADYSRLQLARLYLNKKDVVKAELEIEYVFSKEIDFKNQSLSIILSFYELLARNEFYKVRKKYVDEKIDLFVKVILNSLDSNFEQPYKVVEKLSSHLSYMQKDAYNEICEILPFPSNIENNRFLRYAYAKIMFSQYKMFKYSENEASEKMEVTLSISEKYFKTIDFENDFERKQLLDLYIASEQYDKALDFTEEFEEKEEPFYLQSLCKILRGKNQLDEALIAIDKALLNSKGLKDFFIAAFLNDKAEIYYLNKNKYCINFLEEAIEKQNTQKTKDLWISKKEKWFEEL